MFWNIFLATVGSLIQLASAFIRWRWNRKDLTTPAKQRWADIGFISVWLIGTLLIGISTYRGNRQERAHFAFEIHNTFERPANGTLVPYSWFIVGQPLSFGVYITNVGSGSSYNTGTWARAILEPDMSLSSQRDAINQFNVWLQSQTGRATSAVVKGEHFFVTANGNILTPEDYNNLISDRRIAYVLARVSFEDDFGSHIAETYRILEPQGPRMLPGPLPGPVNVVEIFALCEENNGER